MKMDRFFDVDDGDTEEIYPEKNHFKRAFYIFNKAMTIFNNILNDNHPATTVVWVIWEIFTKKNNISKHSLFVRNVFHNT